MWGAVWKQNQSWNWKKEITGKAPAHVDSSVDKQDTPGKSIKQVSGKKSTV